MKLLQRWRARSAAAGDEGFGLVELLVSIVVFAIIATAVAVGLQSAISTTRQDRMRVQGAHLAARELELARHEFATSATGVADLAGSASTSNPHPLAGQVSGQPLRIDGVPFTVTRSVQWLPAGAGQSACDGGAAVGFPVLAVNVRVTWGAMGGVKPVESTTLLTPPKKVVSGTASFIAVQVVGAAGTPQTAMQVQLTGGGTSSSAVTADDGCAVFQVNPTSYPQSYDLTAYQSGYVDRYGNATGVRTTTIAAAGTLVRPAPISYDRAATLTATMALNASSASAGYALPTTLPPYTLYNSGLAIGSTTTRTVASTGATTTITGLWPFTSGYESWPGACDAAAAGHPAATVISAGGTGTITHTLVPLMVSVQQATGAPYSGGTITATPDDPTSCSASENPLTLGTTDGSGVLKTSLPAGSWRIAVRNATAPSTGWPLLSGLSLGDPAQTVAITLGV